MTHSFVKIHSETIAENELSLHSFEKKNGVILSKEVIEKFSLICSEYGNKLISTLSEKFVKLENNNIPIQSLNVLFRRSVFPLIFFYWNQILRIHSLNVNGNSYSVFPIQEEESEIQIIEDFEKKILKTEFNEYALYYLSEIWGFRKEQKREGLWDLVLVGKSSPRNYLFFLGDWNEIRKKIIAIIERVLKPILFFSRFPVLTFANAETSLRIRGMYLFHFRPLSLNWRMPDLKKNETLREELFSEDSLFNDELVDYFLSLGLTRNQFNISLKLLRQFLVRFFPNQYLEGLSYNFYSASKFILKSDRKAILSSGDGDTYSTFLIAYGKGNGFKIIKAQHGGHYGYLKDNRPALDIELPSADTFFTWGWTKMHFGKQIEHINCVAMPSPWLSERKKYWKSLDFTREKNYDILWMPQMMKRFIGSPQGASSIRRDVIEDFSKEMISFIKLTKSMDLKVFCKPYNLLTVNLLKDTYKTIQEIAGNQFVRDDNFDKGLHKELVNKAKLVVWDQPGTGFLECLVCGIPTMVIWTRLFCEEESWCKEDFRKLEEIGIVHRDIKSFGKEISLFKDSISSWMLDKKRRFIIDEFCRKYAFTEDKWWKIWQSYLSKNI